ncbi:transmembrane and coiled-coil domain-containing protein 3 [Exaiptasia diaphana]|uniref:Cation/H+ exchanger transmembrane domain-containing protein n=1 Tax=Exaiptasia diaphana TaxID=2652724 RepID=A0A913XEU1_EXADI|nr:transmembrane and coiled-coil domain-containing protein 3 [Exaiptasia diaphana]KXJ26172.1 Transmembrane and coiled-coil domain-containing protein 3 [Exaiptasia diaphana]
MTKNIIVYLFIVNTFWTFSSCDPTRWDSKSCRKINGLFHTKEQVTQKLKHVLEVEKKKKSLSNAQIRAINIYQAELNDTERAIFEAMSGLRKLLHEDYKSVVSIKEAIKQRLDSFKTIALRQEVQFNSISEAEKDLTAEHKLNGKNNSTGRGIGKLIDSVLSDVFIAADKLEKKLSDNTFEKQRNAKGASIEAVVRVNDDQNEAAGDGQEEGKDNSENEKDDGMSILVDSQSNEFVLAKSKDATVPHEDLHLIKDIIWICILSFFGACLCTVVELPTMFGFVMSGMVLGPTGVNIIKSVVQVETLGEFGVFFILFTVGLEFSPERIRKVWKVSVGGSTLMMVLIVVFGMLGGMCFGILPQQSAFVAACLSLSSTPLIVKFLGNKAGDHSNKEHTNGNHDYSSSLLGILVMQDVYLGLIVAILPALSGHIITTPSSKVQHGIVHHIIHGSNTSHTNLLMTAWVVFEVLGSMIGLLILCIMLARYLIGPFYRTLQRIGSMELYFLGTIALAFCMLIMTEHLGISMELGCFVTGVIISANGEQIVKQVSHLVEPIKDFLSCLFFASIGLHVFPSFVLNELSVTLTLTFGVVTFKFLVGVFVLRLFLPKSTNNKYIVAAGLAQVSEFSFVLGSRARRFHLISREVYLLILSVTTLSLLFAPLVWRASLWKFGEKRSTHQKPV